MSDLGSGGVAKTSALIRFAITAKLICVFVIAYTKIRFSHDAAYLIPHKTPSTRPLDKRSNTFSDVFLKNVI